MVWEVLENISKDYSIAQDTIPRVKIITMVKSEKYQNPFCIKKMKVINKKIDPLGDCYHLLLIHNAPKLSTMYLCIKITRPS